MPDSESKLTRIRGGHRARTTTLCKQLEEKLTGAESSQAWVRDTVEEIVRQRDMVRQLDSKIIELVEDIETEIQGASEFNLQTAKVLRKAETFLSTSSVQSNKNVKLPTINLKTFDGNPLNWQGFWDLFKSSIHDRSDIDDATKFYYLRSQLKGDAGLFLENFDHTKEDYQEALELLKSTFGKKKTIIQTRIHCILDLESPRATYTDLNKFRSLYEAHIRGLKALGVNTSEAGYLYAAILQRKLPAKVTDSINRTLPSDEIWTLDTLRQGIERELDYLRCAEENFAAAWSSTESIKGES